MKIFGLLAALLVLNVNAAVKTGEYSGQDMWSLLNSKNIELVNPYCVVAGLRTYDKLSLNAAVGNKLTTIALSESFYESPINSGLYKKSIKVDYRFASEDEQIIDNHVVHCGLK